ncbi:MAG: aspartate ammonia-lyase, partial [Planctomycetes bacterium]|nr:aspartate ammonia-lyase [Planctomycetota bacterium]
MTNQRRGAFRIERDSLGEVEVPTEALYGAQTARAATWSLTDVRMPGAVITALAQIKAAAARV